MNERQIRILEALIDEFLTSALPVGSARLLETDRFHFSGATLRNEMAELEEAGLLTHPHTSAGRIPTTQGYRFYVDQILDREVARKQMLKILEQKREHLAKREARSKLWQAVGLLAEVSQNLGFATLPDRQTIFVGISNVLRQPEFLHSPEVMSQVMEIVENDFFQILDTLPIGEELEVYIGEENLIPRFASCSMLALRYNVNGSAGIMGILGPKRMNYGFNSALLEHLRDNLNNL